MDLESMGKKRLKANLVSARLTTIEPTADENIAKLKP